MFTNTSKMVSSRVAVVPAVLVIFIVLFLINLKHIPHEQFQENLFLDREDQPQVPTVTGCDSSLQLAEIQTPKTALASFPGSGSTWLRHLIQQATGLGTSSLHCDPELQTNGFPYECYSGIAQGRPILVKTHVFMHSDWLKTFDKAVVLIRNPYDAIVAYYNWRFLGQREEIDEDTFNSTIFRTTAFTDAGVWLSTYTTWLMYYHGRVLPVLYEDLRSNVRQEMEKILSFLQIQVNESILDCVERSRHVIFYGELSMDTAANINLFSTDLRDTIDKYKGLVVDILEKKYSKTVLSW